MRFTLSEPYSKPSKSGAFVSVKFSPSDYVAYIYSCPETIEDFLGIKSVISEAENFRGEQEKYETNSAAFIMTKHYEFFKSKIETALSEQYSNEKDVPNHMRLDLISNPAKNSASRFSLEAMP